MNPIPSSYITRKLDQVKVDYPNATEREQIRKVHKIAREELIQWIFYLTPEEWHSTGLRFAGATPDPHALDLAELDQMARTIQIYLPASIKRLQDRDKALTNFCNILDLDKTPVYPSLEETLEFFKTFCEQNGWTWPPKNL